MIEYVYDVIRASAGEMFAVSAKLTDEEGVAITEASHLMVFDDDNHLFMVDGEFDGEGWVYTIPAEATKGLRGRYWYCICDENNASMCFKKPLYLM